MKKIKVREIFYSIQGEGGRQGCPSIFIRLADCNLNCWFCDTDWSKGTMMTIEEVITEIRQYNCNWIVWTGGEPTLQLSNDILAEFPNRYKHAIETNGTNSVPTLIDYISCSPKMPYVTVDRLHKNFPLGVNEFRFPVDREEELPRIADLPKADNYFLSPLFLGKPKERFQMSMSHVQDALNIVKLGEGWRLSLQIHKLIGER